MSKLPETLRACAGYRRHLWNISREKVQADLIEAADKITELQAAVNRLVKLKNHKDTVGKDHYYLKNQPEAWEQAKQHATEGIKCPACNEAFGWEK